MKKMTAISVTVLVAFSFAGQAIAMGGGMMQGGTKGSMASHMRQGGMSGMQHDSSNAAGGKHEAMHVKGTQQGPTADAVGQQTHMNGTGQHSMMNNGAGVEVTDTPSPSTSTSGGTQPATN